MTFHRNTRPVSWAGLCFGHGALAAVAFAVVLMGCDSEARRTPPPPAPKSKEASRVPATQKSVATSGPVGKFEKSRRDGTSRVVAVGDLHGDLAGARAVLRLAKLIDESDKWIGADTTFVQTGDQLDRGDDERAILELLENLVEPATKAGGAVVVLNGNHETMNVALDFRYVTKGAFLSFPETEFVSMSTPPPIRQVLEQLPEQARGRGAAFMPGGVYARKLAERPIVAVVGDSVFVHGGVLPAHVQYGLDKLNQETAKWMRGEGQPPPIMQAEDAPVWTRAYSEETPSAAACAELASVLHSLGIKRMVVGHTVQKSGITSGCDKRVWRIDTGIAAHYGGPRQALEIVGDDVKILQAD